MEAPRHLVAGRLVRGRGLSEAVRRLRAVAAHALAPPVYQLCRLQYRRKLARCSHRHLAALAHRGQEQAAWVAPAALAGRAAPAPLGSRRRPGVAVECRRLLEGRSARALA